MTRVFVFGLLLAFGGSATADEKQDVQKERAPFQGEWKVVSATIEGTPASKEETESAGFTFDGEKLIVTKKGGKPEAGTFAVDSKVTPATIDLISPKGEKAPGLYKFDKDGKLTLVFIQGKDAERPKGFDDKKATVLVLEKVKK